MTPKNSLSYEHVVLTYIRYGLGAYFLVQGSSVPPTRYASLLSFRHTPAIYACKSGRIFLLIRGSRFFVLNIRCKRILDNDCAIQIPLVYVTPFSSPGAARGWYATPFQRLFSFILLLPGDSMPRPFRAVFYTPSFPSSTSRIFWAKDLTKNGF